MSTEESTTAKLIETLGDDVDRCHAAVLDALNAGEKVDGGVEADYEFDARQLIRAIFAFVEGITFSIKMTGFQACIDNDLPVSEAERLMAAELRYDLNDRGEIVERPAMLSLSKNLRFALSLYEYGTSQKGRFDPSAEWWSCFQKSIAVRDRLTHPKMPDDLDVSPTEMITAMKAYGGFVQLLESYGESGDVPEDTTTPA